MTPRESLECRLDRLKRSQVHVQKRQFALASWNFLFDLLDCGTASFLRSRGEDDLRGIALGELVDRLFA